MIMDYKGSEERGLLTLNNDMIRASYKLSVNEIRLILIAIAQMPKGEKDKEPVPLDPMKPYYITKEDFIKLGVEPNNVAREIRSACSDLLDRKVFINTPFGVLGTHWVHNILHFKTDVFEELKKKYPRSKYDDDFIEQLKKHNLMDSLPFIEKSNDNVMARIIFHADIIPYVSQLQQHFTQLKLTEMAGFSSFYSFRVYMMMMQWRDTGLVVSTLTDFREMLDITDKYEATKDLRKWVLNTAIDEINAKSLYTVQYELLNKNGKSGKGIKLTHLKIKFKPKAQADDAKSKEITKRDPNTIDWINNQTDTEANKVLTPKQLARVVNSKKFIADYAHLVTPQNPANASSGAWITHMATWLKKDPSKFNKRPMKDYLDDEQADKF